MPKVYWNENYNRNVHDPITKRQNWCETKIKIHTPYNHEYCKIPTDVAPCQYLRYENNDQTKPFCAWNLEFRGDPMRQKIEKNKLQLEDDNPERVLRAEYCRLNSSRSVYSYSAADHWENTLTKQDLLQEQKERQDKLDKKNE